MSKRRRPTTARPSAASPKPRPGPAGMPSTRQAARRDGRQAAAGGRGTPARTWLLVAGGLVLVATVAFVILGQGANQPTGLAGLRSPTMPPTTSSMTPPPGGFPAISGVECNTTEQLTYHVHAHLEIRVDGQQQSIPGTIGQRATCIYWLHTHATDGIIHIEAPSPANYTLGQFFDVWGAPLDASHVASATVPAGSRIWAFVNGTPFSGDPRTIPLSDRELIELQVGPAAIPPLG